MADVKYSAQPRGRSATLAAGTTWLICGGVAAAVSLVMLVPMAMQNLRPVGIPGTAAIVVCTLYAGMVIVRHSTPRGRLRTTLLALDLLAIVFVTALTAVLVAGRAVG